MNTASKLHAPPVARRLRGAPLTVVAALVLVAACGGGESSTGPAPSGNGSPVGSYAMNSVDGHPLPYMYDEGTVSGGVIKRYWLSGDVTFKADSTFAIKLVSKTTGPGQSGTPHTTSWSGTWRLEPGGVELTNGGGKAHWTSTNGLATLNAPGTYTKVSGGQGSLQMAFQKK